MKDFEDILINLVIWAAAGVSWLTHITEGLRLVAVLLAITVSIVTLLEKVPKRNEKNK